MGDTDRSIGSDVQDEGTRTRSIFSQQLSCVMVLASIDINWFNRH
jgi:hypothetical protein